MSSYKFPQIFKRILNAKTVAGKHLIALRESKQYRQDNQAVLVQGLKTITELRDQGVKINSVIVTAKKDPQDPSQVKYPATEILKNPKQLPASKYFLTDVELTRRILGTVSRPGSHEIYAELQTPPRTFKASDRLLVFDKISDPGNIGTLVRTAKGLGWKSGLITSGTCDLYNDKALRASRGLVLTWSHEQVSLNRLLSFLKEHGMTPIVADMLPKNSKTVWSPDYGSSDAKDVKPGSGVWFWNFKEKEEIPKKVALVLSCEHHGVDELLDDEIRISVPLDSSVESLNVASAGSIIMTELNRLLRQRV
ncbi:hypothetical protein G6F56_007605 [Rhizopus delemar]|nr:hypothetical protein G6F56_007605 [Rhizopus delemar]